MDGKNNIYDYNWVLNNFKWFLNDFDDCWMIVGLAWDDCLMIVGVFLMILGCLLQFVYKFF